MLLYFLIKFQDIYGQPPRCFTGISLQPFRLFLTAILKFWGIGVALMRITSAKLLQATALVKRTHRIGFSVFELFRKIVVDFGLLHILKYATQLSCNFQHSHCTFVTILLRPFARLFINLAMRIRALFSQSASIFGLVEQAFWRVPSFTK